MKLTKKLITTILLSLIILAALAYSISRLYAMAGLSTGSSGNSGTTGGSLTKGLVGHWNLDSESYNPATKRFTDKSAFSNHGTSSNAATFTTDHTGQADRAMTFNGTDDYVNISGFGNKMPTSEITIEAWIKPAIATGQHDGFTFVPLEPQASSRVTVHFPWDGSIIWQFGKPFVSLSATFQSSWAGVWGHYVFQASNSGNYMKIYRNGVQIATVASMSNFTQVSADWVIGGRTTKPFSGSIDEVRIYNRALSAEEVKMSYDFYRPKFSAGTGEKGLVGHWNLDSESYNPATKRFTDKSAFSNHGTSANAAGFTTDHMGQADRAMTFNGTSDYVDVGQKTSLSNSSVTLEAWFKPNSLHDGTIIGRWNTLAPASENDFSLRSNGNIFTEFWVGGVGYTIAGGTAVADAWNHAVFTYKSGEQKLYLNNVMVNSAAVSGNLNTGSSHQMNIGWGYILTAYSYFSGSIDEVRIYNRALSAEEILAQYNAYRPKFSAGNLQKGLVLDMPMNSTYTKSATVLTDRTPYSNNGTAVNGAVIGTTGTTFDGVDDYVQLPTTGNYNGTSGTVSVWVKLSTQPGINGYMTFVGTAPASEAFGWKFEYIDQAGVNKINFRKWTPEISSLYTYTLNVGVWSNLITVWNVTNRMFYINGVLVDTSSIGAPTSGSDIACIGADARSDCGGQLFNGSIDEVRIYNRALSADEIQLSYDQSKGKH